MARKRMQNVPRDEMRAHRQREVLAMKVAGAGYQEIARAMGISMSTAHGDVQRALKDIPKDEADQLREAEIIRLDRIQRAVWGDALKGKLGAIDRVLKVIDRRAKMLGLDAPQQLQVGASEVDLDRVVRELVETAISPVADLDQQGELPRDE